MIYDIPDIQNRLFVLREEEFRLFQSKLIPSINPESVIGVRTPLLRGLAAELYSGGGSEEFFAALPHKYFEENNIHGFLIEHIKDFDRALIETERFLPHIDNWATCDQFRPKVFKKNLPALLPKIREWLKSGHTYTVRYAMGLLLSFYLEDGAFDPEYPTLVAAVRSEEYYVNMMAAWYFATALAKQYDAVLPYITERKLSEWTHKKTIRKAIESYRISDEKKIFLRGYIIKRAR